MLPNRSPWIAQLARQRPVEPLSRSVAADVAIVGGGIAGVATAYFVLKNTQKRVVLLEADKVAHGATGHNAGQVVSYFERPFRELVQEFGLRLAAEAQLAIESAWDLLSHVQTEAKLKTPLYRFTGYAGCCSKEQIVEHLENNYLRAQSRMLDVEDILIAEEAQYIGEIPAKYKDLYAMVPQADILALLETNNTHFTALLSYPKGCMNSALFTEEVVGFLLAMYSDRFSLYEGSGVQTVDLRDHDVVLTVGEHRVMAGEVVLCTNGFEGFSIRNEGGVEINSRFHHQIAGTVGYMMGYFEPMLRPPTAISYLFGVKHNDPYFYLTRRRHEYDREVRTLVCVGGPETPWPERATYSRQTECDESVQDLIGSFLKKNYKNYEPSDFAFCWHGLMGYTPNGVRLIGKEPCNPRLLYNLGCNGVGILPSLYGGKRIADILGEAKIPQSIFDPSDQRCVITPAA